MMHFHSAHDRRGAGSPAPFEVIPIAAGAAGSWNISTGGMDLPRLRRTSDGPDQAIDARPVRSS